MRGLFNLCLFLGQFGLWFVSIRLADAWPFQLRQETKIALEKRSFNPPCGCVAFSTPGSLRPRSASDRFQSALRMRGLFNSAQASASLSCQVSQFQSALRMRGLFNRQSAGVIFALHRRFNPPCGCVAFSTSHVAPGSGNVIAFQSALRMRGLFNVGRAPARGARVVVSIRLADAWPFQLRPCARSGRTAPCFNPPCGCVAFSTWFAMLGFPARLGFNPPCGCVAFSTMLSSGLSGKV